MAKKSAKSKSSKPLKKPVSQKPTPVNKKSVKSKAQNKRPMTGQEKTLRDQLVDQIHAMTLTLDEESLRNLLQDAAILAHNERVLKDFIVKGKSGPRPPMVRAAIEEGKDGTFFIIILNNYRNFLSLEEMQGLVKLCHSAVNVNDAAHRLYAWVESDRRDIKKNSKIADHTDPSLPDLWEKVVSNYTFKG